jgi:polyisoprenyl-teichoic acid--peptidoglycan teichoic acid transferase
LGRHPASQAPAGEAGAAGRGPGAGVPHSPGAGVPHSPGAGVPHNARRVGRRQWDDDRFADQKTMVIVTGHRRPRSLGKALLITLGAALLPGSGHLMLHRRVGWAILAGFLLLIAVAVGFVLTVPPNDLVEYLLSPDMLVLAIVGCFVTAVFWLAVVLRTYELAKPPKLSIGKQFVGSAVVFLLCLTVSAPFAFAGYTVNAQRNLLNALFPSTRSPAGDANAIKKPRINILLLGSDAGEGRVGTRTDTMVVASIDTKTGRTILFGLPRNIAFAQFPPGSTMARQFPRGFHDPTGAMPGNYLLNGVYAYGEANPAVAPSGPSRDPGLNLLSSSIAYMLGLNLDYYIQVDMQGFASIVDALGGLDVNVGPHPVPMGGIGPFGEVVKPFGYIPAGRQHLDGEQALWFARSRTNSTDYVRMGRQRCLLQYLIDQKSPMDVLTNFKAVSTVTTNSVSTNIPQNVLPSLVNLAGKAKSRPLESISFDPSLPDPEQPDGRFNTNDPDFDYIRDVVRDAIAPPPSTSAVPRTTSAGPTSAGPTSAGPTTSRATGPSRKPTTSARSRISPQPTTTTVQPPPPVSLDEACSNTATE